MQSYLTILPFAEEQSPSPSEEESLCHSIPFMFLKFTETLSKAQSTANNIKQDMNKRLWKNDEKQKNNKERNEEENLQKLLALTLQQMLPVSRKSIFFLPNKSVALSYVENLGLKTKQLRRS
ncbi:hypothetical protein CEXT_668611 [Caerostris extrusa]|uniref:Uncharacterized protein n=1 Tax=Caerostris extrusa TaxID=172846 RepID=A0AAV4T687_CAEEX|nr:hypothetical protein CEXT_668611 [Caerostris extrusa]